MLTTLKNEARHFRSFPAPMRVLLLTNLLYAAVLPLLELFVAAYILRESHDSSLVVVYTLCLYTGVPLCFLLNGFLLRVVAIAKLYSFGLLLTGVAMLVMMSLPRLDATGVGAAGLIMGTSVGFFWANRDFLALESTDDATRNYYFSVETVFYTLSFIVVPFLAGICISTGEARHWYAPRSAYLALTGVVFALTAVAAWSVHRGNFRGPAERQFVFFRFHRDWYWMLAMGAGKGVAQAAIFIFPVLLILTFVGKEGSLGGLVSAGAALSAVVLYLIGRFSKPGHRLAVFGAGLLLFLAGGLANMLLFSAAGVLIYQLCVSLSRPLLDAAYFPIQMRVIDHIAALERRSKFAYIFHHEYGLYFGRLSGCVLFLLAARAFSPEFALRYLLVAIAALQALSLPVAALLLRKFSAPALAAETDGNVLTASASSL